MVFEVIRVSKDLALSVSSHARLQTVLQKASSLWKVEVGAACGQMDALKLRDQRLISYTIQTFSGCAACSEAAGSPEDSQI